MHRTKKLVALLVFVGLLAVGTAVAVGVNQDVVKQAAAATKRAEKGTSKLPSTVSRPGAKGKKVFIIDAGHVSESSGIPDDGATEAAKALGWTVVHKDGNLQTASYSGLVNDAVAQGADGIIMDAIDCKLAQSPLKLAKAKHIVVIPIYAFDCNDPVGGNHGSALFTGCTNYGGLACNNLSNFTKSYGADQANYVINATKGKGTVLVVNDASEYTVLNYTGKGFEAQLKKAGQPYVDFQFKIADLLAGKLQQDVTTELLKLKAQHVKVAWVKSPFSAATVGGIANAVKTTAPGTPVMGGEGFPDELKIGVTAANVISSTWTGWSAIDAMNSAFIKKPSQPSGIGWTIVKGNHSPTFPNFKAAFKKAWGK